MANEMNNTNAMAAWILAQNEERHDAANCPELALLAGFSFSQVSTNLSNSNYLASQGSFAKAIVSVDADASPESVNAQTIKPGKAA